MDKEKESRIRNLVDKHPALREQDENAINDLFDSYIFRRRKTREIWTSCCRKHAVLEEGHPILDAPHIRGPRTDFGRPRCSHGVWGYPGEPEPEPTACPICGKIGKVKELGRSGVRKNLWSFRRAVVLRRQRGVLWALAYDSQKDYERDENLTALPYLHLIGIYRFDGKSAEYTGRYWWGDCAWEHYGRIDGQSLPRNWVFPEPFHWDNEYGLGYDTINKDELAGTPYEYCGFAAYEPKHEKCMKFLALCTVYPRQVEMLMKAGLENIVTDRINGKLNAQLLNWNEKNVLKSFGLPKEDLQAWLQGGHQTEVLCAYKRFVKARLPVTLEQTQEIYREYGIAWFERLTMRMKRYGIGCERITNYLKRESKTDKNRSAGVMAGLWCDYADAADKLGLDMKNPVYLLPKNLRKNHDEKTAAAAAVAQRKAGRSRVKSLTKKYTFWSERWLIRPPVSAAEIVAEGEKLKHCVGGYADRHARGTTTILFLRDRQRPGKPLVTIEMRDTYLVQIHGYRNEAEACSANPQKISPRELYKEFLDDWLAWIEGGSKRDRNGVPVVPERQKEKASA